jgi:hypothetical protein
LLTVFWDIVLEIANAYVYVYKHKNCTYLSCTNFFLLKVFLEGHYVIATRPSSISAVAELYSIMYVHCILTTLMVEW